MKNSHRFVALASAVAIAATATPALAYIDDPNMVPDPADQVSDDFIPIFSPFNEDPGSAFRKNRKVTSRAIRGNRNQNRPNAGSISNYGGERGVAEEMTNGLSMLPVRGAWRQPGLRNRNRHILAHTVRGGRWNVLDYSQGDRRRRPVGLAGSTLRYPSRLIPEVASPARVGTSEYKDFPNWRSWARGRSRGSKVRNLNDFNRANFDSEY
jgi:hypothetical protein